MREALSISGKQIFRVIGSCLFSGRLPFTGSPLSLSPLLSSLSHVERALVRTVRTVPVNRETGAPLLYLQLSLRDVQVRTKYCANTVLVLRSTCRNSLSLSRSARESAVSRLL